MLSYKEIEKIKDKLFDCDNVEDMFTILSNEMDLKNCKPGPIIKPVFIKGIIQGIKLLNPNKK